MSGDRGWKGARVAYWITPAGKAALEPRCDVRLCANLAASVADVPLFRASGRTVELGLCVQHLAELHESSDPIQTAREWLLASVAP